MLFLLFRVVHMGDYLNSKQKAKQNDTENLSPKLQNSNQLYHFPG